MTLCESAIRYANPSLRNLTLKKRTKEGVSMQDVDTIKETGGKRGKILSESKADIGISSTVTLFYVMFRYN